MDYLCRSLLFRIELNSVDFVCYFIPWWVSKQYLGNHVACRTDSLLSLSARVSSVLAISLSRKEREELLFIKKMWNKTACWMKCVWGGKKDKSLLEINIRKRLMSSKSQQLIMMTNFKKYPVSVVLYLIPTHFYLWFCFDIQLHAWT